MNLCTDLVLQSLRHFNSYSVDPADHFKLIQPSNSTSPPQLRLCCSHPRFITCTCDDQWVHVRGDGPERLRLRFAHGSQESLGALLQLLQQQRGVGDDLIDWELEDWVGPGYPCRLWERRERESMLEFGADDLWCVGLLPAVEARLHQC